MSLATIEADIRNAVGQAQAWTTELVEKHLPALAAEAAKAANSPVIHALEQAGALIDPEAEQLIASLIAKLAAAATTLSGPVQPDTGQATTAEAEQAFGTETQPDAVAEPVAG